MSNFPSQDCNSKTRAQQPLYLVVLSRGSIALGGILVIVTIAGSWWLRNFIQKDLVPLAEQNLTTTLSRPVKLGKVKGYSFSGVQFGASEIPATTTDSDRATVEKVDVSFDFLQLLFQRRLKLDVTLINLDLYLEEDSEGRWVTTTITRPNKRGPIKTDLDKLRFRNGKVVLVASGGDKGVGGARGARGEKTSLVPPTPSTSSTPPTSPTSPSDPTPQRHMLQRGEPAQRSGSSLLPTPSSQVTFTQLNGVAQLLENNRLIKYEVAATPISGGNVFVRGKSRPRTNTNDLEDDLDLQVDGILASDVTRLIELPVELQAGRVKGDLRVYSVNRRSPLLFGTATMQGVQVQVERMPRAFVNSQGNLSFNKTEIKLENVTTNYGKVPLVANGTIDRIAGFNLAARVNAVSAPNVQETLKLKLPLPVAANLNADLLLTGQITEPFLTGKVNTIDNPSIS